MPNVLFGLGTIPAPLRLAVVCGIPASAGYRPGLALPPKRSSGALKPVSTPNPGAPLAVWAAFEAVTEYANGGGCPRHLRYEYESGSERISNQNPKSKVQNPYWLFLCCRRPYSQEEMIHTLGAGVSRVVVAWVALLSRRVALGRLVCIVAMALRCAGNLGSPLF